MAQNVNVTLGTWAKTGSTVVVDQYRMPLSIEWTDAAGQTQTWSGNVTFPNDLALVPAAWVGDVLKELIYKAARKRLGIDA